MNPLIPLAMLVGGLGMTAGAFWWGEKHDFPPGHWMGGMAKLGLLIGLMGLVTITPVTMIWLKL